VISSFALYMIVAVISLLVSFIDGYFSLGPTAVTAFFSSPVFVGAALVESLKDK
jgi:hypothetical protein